MDIKKIMVVPFKVTGTKSFKLTEDQAKQFNLEPDIEVFEFKGYASTFGNIDRGGDRVKQGAFIDTINEIKASGDPLPVLWQHDSWTPVGIYVDMLEDSKGLFIHGIMPKDDDFVKGRVIPQMRVGSVRKMSIGYSVDEFEWDGEVRDLIKLKLWEISLVTIPMNNQADVTEFKKICIDDLGSIDERTFENMLKTGLVTSAKTAKRIASLVKSELYRDGPSEDHRDGEDWSEVLGAVKSCKKILTVEE